jgi:hypothetical protein
MDVWCVCAFFCVYVVLCLGGGLATRPRCPTVSKMIKKLINQPVLQSGSKRKKNRK